jgi:hypothetical protein
MSNRPKLAKLYSGKRPRRLYTGMWQMAKQENIKQVQDGKNLILTHRSQRRTGKTNPMKKPSDLRM